MKVQHGIVYSDSSGKFGGGVALKGRYGAVVRTKVKPRQPVSNASAIVRSRFTAVSSSWRGLSAADVAGWNAVAKNVKLSDSMGRPYTPSGSQLFNEYNMNLLAIGKTIDNTIPVISAVDTMTSMSLAAAAGAATITLTYAPAVGAAASFKVFATPSIPVGRKVKDSDFRQIHVLVTANASPYALKTAYELVFGATYVAGDVIYVRVVPVNWVPGNAGGAFQASATVSA